MPPKRNANGLLLEPNKRPSLMHNGRTLVEFDVDGDLILVLPATEVVGLSSSITANKAAPEDKSSKEICMLVSSKAMTLVSPVFKAMLRHETFKEGHDLANGMSEIPLPDDDASAFQIILDIVHHNVNRVPKNLDLYAATNIAILVDKYQIHDIVILYVEIWTKELRTSPLPDKLTAELARWLCISWVFGLTNEFQHLTKIAQMQSIGNLQSEHLPGWNLPDLPIPTRVFEKIEEKRQNSIEKAIRFIHSTIDKYEKSPNHCTTTNFKAGVNEKVDIKQKQYACDSTVLGSLQKSAAAKNLWPGPKRPYTGLTWSEVKSRAQCLNIISLCDHAEFPLKNPNAYYSPVQDRPAPNHGVEGSIHAMIETIGDSLCGFLLEEFE